MNQLNVSGDKAVGILVAGDGNSITVFAGGSELHLDMPHRHKLDQPRILRDLLVSDARVTRLVGREDDLSVFKKWRALDAHVAVRTLIGRAGSGKTRLAIEACAAAEDDGWVAGFVDGRELQRFHVQQNLASWRSLVPTLIVVDEAAASASILKEWFTALARQGALGSGVPPTAPLRILLLERHADKDFGWWADLARPESSASVGAERLLQGERPVVLPPLSKASMRRALLTDAMGHAAAILGKAAVHLPTPGVDPAFDALIGNDARLENEPLFLIMAAIAGVERGALAALALGKVELADYIATAEQARLTRLGVAGGLDKDGRLIGHLVAVLTLQRGSAVHALVPLIEEELAGMAFRPVTDSEAIAELLLDALPSDANRVSGLKPDLIGGAHLLRELGGGRLRSAAVRQAIVNRAWPRAGMAVAETLILAAQDLAAGNAGHATITWLDGLAKEVEDPESFRAMLDNLPQDTLALGELAAVWQQRLVDHHRQENAQGDGQSAPQLALSLNNLAFRLKALGQTKRALASAEEAVSLSRSLASARPDFSANHLAMALSNLAPILSDLKQPEAALGAAREAVSIRRDLAAAWPEVFSNDLAMSLSNMAIRLSALKQPEEALGAAAEAVAIHRQLAAAHPVAYAPILATSIHTLAIRLSARGQREAALRAAGEAVALFRDLAAARPDAFVPGLAASLSNLSNRLFDLKQPEAALVAQARVEEAVALFRQLAEVRPDPFKRNLADSLNNLAMRLADLKQPEAALAAAHEAVVLRRHLAAGQPDIFAPDLARSLSLLGDLLEAAEQLPVACAADHEAVQALRAPFLTEPGAHAGLMRSIYNDYLRRHRAAALPLDKALLLPIAEMFQHLENGAS